MACYKLKKVTAVAMAVALTATMMPQNNFESFITPIVAEAADQEVSQEVVTLNGADVDTAKTLDKSLTFKGFGVLSCNSTSSLLMDYKAQNPEKYQELLEVLFGGEHPIMNQVKIEMGNDRNTSTGADPCTMRSEDEYPNIKRTPGFQLAADAKKVNPNVRVTILRWCSPTWVKDNDDVYKWYKNTILAAYREYGYMVDYVNPGVNEQGADLTWTKEFSNRVKTDTDGFLSEDENKGFQSEEEKELFHQIQTIISDEVGIGSFGDEMVSDEELREAVDVSAFHYNTDDDNQGNFKKLSDTYNEEIWNSEAQATFGATADRPNNNMNDSNSIGTGIGGKNSALEMANAIVKGFNNSRRTHFIYQPAIGAFYEGFQYTYKELVSARDPWSGYVYYDGALAILEHFSQFAKTGWENEDNTAGIWRAIPQASKTTATGTNPANGRNGGPNYITLSDPDKKDFSTVIVNDSGQSKIYKIKAEDMNLGDDDSMEVWETRAADEGEAFNSNYKKCVVDNLKPDSEGYYVYEVKPWSMVTMTTLDCSSDPAYAKQLPSVPERTVLDTDETGDVQDTTDNILYADNFEYEGKTVKTIGEDGKLSDTTEPYLEARGGEMSATPRYTDDSNGAFEVYKASDDNHVMRQQIGPGMAGNAWNGGDPVTTIGDFRWTNYKASVNVMFEADAGYSGIGIRQQGGSAKLDSSAYALKFWQDGGWQLLRYGSAVANGNVADGNGGVKIDNFKTGANVVHKLSIEGAGSEIKAYIDDVLVATYKDNSPQLSGRIQLASDFQFVQFDDLKVEEVEGYSPYYSDSLDNLHMLTWDEDPQPVLQYNEKWNHGCGTSMSDTQRTTSVSTGQGATLTYTFNGTGIDLSGSNNGQTTLNVTVDGKPIALNASTVSSGNFMVTYSLRGLKDGEHTIVFETANDNAIKVDSVATVSAVNESNVDTTDLKATYEKYSSLNPEDYNEDSFATLQNVLDMAKEAVADPNTYRLDQEGAAGLVILMKENAANLVVSGATTDIREMGLQSKAVVKGDLPSSVEIDGTEQEILWNDGQAEILANADDYTKVTLQGTTVNPITADGLKQRIKVDFEVIPEGVQYFIDSGASEEAPEYNAVKNTVNLLNDKFDQVSDGTNWGYIADGIHVKGGNMDINDKFATGLYQDKADLTYILPLSAGTYTVTAGYREWWGMTRPTAQTVTIPAEGTNDGIEKVITGNDINLSGSNWKITADPITFTLDKDATVIYKATAKGSQKPVISWIAVAGEKKEETADTVSKNALQTMIEKVEELNEKDYSTASWNVLQECLSAAKDVYANENATQAVVDQAYLDLVTAWKDLEVGLNTSAAEAVIKEAEAVLASSDLSEYRPSSVQAVRDSLDAVKVALANPETTQEQLNDAVTQLIDALIQLKGIVNADALQRVIDVAEELLQDKDRYTTDTVKALEEAVNAAKEVTANEDRTQQQVNDAYEKLTNAIAGLVVRGDKSVLKPLVEKAEEILANTDAYTSSSLEGLAEVFASAKEVYDDVDAVQTEINTAAANLAVELSQVRILGDVNNDQKVDTADAAEVLKVSAELQELSEADKDAADVKKDGIIDTADAALIEQYAAELITEF